MGALSKPDPAPASTDVAEVTVLDGRQAVLLPENVRVEAPRLHVVKHGAGLSLSPLRKPLTNEEREQVLADLDRFRRELGDFMPEGREQPPLPDGNDLAL